MILFLPFISTTLIRSLGVPKSGASGQKGMISYPFKESKTDSIFFVLPS